MGLGATILISIFLGGAWKAYKNPKPARELPFFKPLGTDTLTDADGKVSYRSKFHKIPPFKFVNQQGDTVTESVLKGKVAIVDYFFTTCQSICPIMTDGLVKLAKEQNGNKDLIILSHTVDPETDTVATMEAYARTKGIRLPQWHLLTGSKYALYKQAREGYFLDAHEGNGGAEDFIHTQLFALIDKEGHIRGYYDGTSEEDLKRLRIDLDLLFKYYAYVDGGGTI